MQPVEAPSAAQQGFEEGRAAGLQQGLADAEALLAREVESRVQVLKTQWEQAEQRRKEEHAQRQATLEALLQAVQKAMPERFLVLERQAVELAYEALCKILGPQAGEPVHGRAGLLADLLQQGMRHLKGQAWLGVKLSAQDHAALMNSEAGRALSERHPEMPFVIDPSLAPLDVVIQSDHGQLDVGLNTQLTRLRDLWVAAGVPPAGAGAGGET